MAGTSVFVSDRLAWLHVWWFNCTSWRRRHATTLRRPINKQMVRLLHLYKRELLARTNY